MNKLTKRSWLSFIIIGLVGQFAWTIENMYFNVFLYKTISTEPGYIASMVAASAVVATLTTLVMGAVSDRIGRRKPFICAGYILWGLSTMAFGMISVENAGRWFPAANAVSAAAVMVIVMDCVMTFFGSSANDAAFNAYVTDSTSKSNRGKVEAVLAVLPLMSMLVIFGAFDKMTQASRWREFFLIFGIAVTLTGIASIWLLKESAVQKKKTPFFSDLVYGFRFSVMHNNKKLYTALFAFLVFSIAVQVFMPYLIIYMQYYLKIDAYAIVLGVVLITASAVSVIGGREIDKVGKLRFAIPASGVMFAGLVAMFFARGFAAVIIAGIIMMSGYMLVTAALSATIRDYTPLDKVGHFQGIRMIFAVMLPMIVGPFIGSAVIKGSSSTYEELGAVKNVPTPYIFLASAVVLMLVAVPIIKLRRGEKNENSVG
ncbi:MAG: MFS transporter [Oscillospiraceae bacterium]